MTRKIIYILLVIFGIFLIGSGLKQSTNINKSLDSNKVSINNQEIKVEIADDFYKIKQGLSYREKLDKDRGMLFVFNDKNERIFWMKDMNFPLDIVWIDDNKIVGIEKNCLPGGSNPEKQYYSKIPVNYVLEVNGGFADKNNIKIGDEVTFEL